MLRRRRPVLRAAAVGGGAYPLGRSRAAQAGQSHAAPAPAPTSEGGLPPGVIAELEQPGELHKKEILTDEEFAEQKRRCLGGIGGAT